MMAGAIYADSGFEDLKDPVARGTGGAAPILGVLQQFAAIGSILIVLGAVQKIFVWNTGFWGKDGLGWSYDLTLVSMLVVILFTDGGRFVLVP